MGPIAPHNAAEFTIARWWATQLRPGQPSALTFVGINRLAELLLRANPHIRRALVATYPFVFVDEFQDTTYAQYDFLHSAFSSGQTIITGVGDDKQRIMVFAGARQDAFQRLQADFGGARFLLLFNFRSSPDLVAIQHVVARALDPNTMQTVAQTVRQVDGDVAQVWSSQTMASEAAHLAQWIANDMATRGRAPRDYALLVKQKSDDYEHELAGAFAIHDLRIRNESHTLGKTSLQDLLSDDLSRLAIAIFRDWARHAAHRPHGSWSRPLSWRCALSAQTMTRALPRSRRTSPHSSRPCAPIWRPPSRRSKAPSTSPLGFLTIWISMRSPEPMPNMELATSSRSSLKHFASNSSLAPMAPRTGQPAQMRLEGVNQIPMMTVHKSKGLEYDTIIFVGLDDRAWWAHTPGDPEGVAAFFVALSRAKQRAIFAFCQQRGQRNNVAELYQLRLMRACLRLRYDWGRSGPNSASSSGQMLDCWPKDGGRTMRTYPAIPTMLR